MDRLARATLVGVAAAVFCVTFVSNSAVAASIAGDGFDYSAGTLAGQAAGTGDWKDEWQGDADIIVFPGGYAYVDALGNVLLVEGSHVETQVDVGSPQRVDRPLNIKPGTTTWQLSDRDDNYYDTGVSADSQAFIVVRVDFADGDEQAWMWLNPELSTTPDIANADASGMIRSFEADFLQIQLENSGSAGVDEIRTGETFADIAPYMPPTPVPEPGTVELVSLGLLGLSICVRRRSDPRR
jgi:hypothetical protein